jgi:zinc protease
MPKKGVDVISKITPGLRRALLSSFFCLFFATTSFGGLADRVFEKTLPNGLKVLLLENHKAPVITFQVWYRVGSRNEQWGRTGLSHMLEHMMFKGSKRFSAQEFTRLIAENGGNDNAFTSEDFTAYFENISSEKAQVLIDLESDRMHNLVLKNEDFQTERMVVMEERRMRTEDDPQGYLMEQVQATAFQTSPYHWPTIGWKEDIERFTLADLKSYYSTYYNPVNAFVVVVGDFRKEDLLPRIEKAFGDISKGLAPDQKKDIDQPQSGERRVFAKREAELPYVVMAYHVPNLRSPDSYVLEVLAALLSTGKSSRLYQSLVQEKQLALSVDADNSLLSRDPSLFTLSAQPLPEKDATEVEKALNEELERLREKPVGLQELEKAKNQLEAAFVYSQASFFYQGMLLAQYEIGPGWRSIDEYLPSIRKVTPEDIRRVVNLYLTPDNRTVGRLIPLPPKEGKPASAESPASGRMIR